MRNKFLVVYFFLLTLYAIFSYALTDPNLVLISWQPYWQFQQWMWQTFFNNAPLLTYTYIGLITSLFIVYGLILRSAPKLNWRWYLLLLLPLFLSYNALSHDVFNYIFNAKMILIYHANPYQQVALDFPQDTWTRFMHNTHTTAPYGWGWTLFSLIPYVLGLNKFLTTWLMFRFFCVLSIGFLWWSMQFLAKKIGKPLNVFWTAAVFLNPLFLIEVVSNSHNDLWMMGLAITALAFIVHKPNWKNTALSLLLLALSISMKFGTAVLFPVWLFLLVRRWKLKKLQWLNDYWPTAASILMFLPLLTDRSQQFNPWYLTWVLVWLPFVKASWWRKLVLVLSLSSLLRYVPWLWNGTFTDQIILQQKLITWVPFILCGVGLLLWEPLKKKKNNFHGEIGKAV